VSPVSTFRSRLAPEQKPTSQNLTISLPTSLVRKAKLHAINTNRSLSQLVKETLEDIVGGASTYNSAMRRQRIFMEKLDLGLKGSIGWKREDLYE